jgi:hypothetical protein
MKLLIAVLVVGSFSAFANADKKDENFAKMKEHIISNIDKRIEVNQKNKSCVQAASKREDIKDCHKKMKDAMEQIKEEREDMRDSFRDMRKRHREERKARKEESKI